MLLRLSAALVPYGILQIGYWPSEPVDNKPAYWSSTKDDKWGAYCLVNIPRAYPYLGSMYLGNHYNVIPCLR